jgi:hypothetical protein
MALATSKHRRCHDPNDVPPCQKMPSVYRMPSHIPFCRSHLGDVLIAFFRPGHAFSDRRHPFVFLVFISHVAFALHGRLPVRSITAMHGVQRTGLAFTPEESPTRQLGEEAMAGGGLHTKQLEMLGALWGGSFVRCLRMRWSGCVYTSARPASYSIELCHLPHRNRMYGRTCAVLTCRRRTVRPMHPALPLPSTVGWLAGTNPSPSPSARPQRRSSHRPPWVAMLPCMAPAVGAAPFCAVLHGPTCCAGALLLPLHTWR